MITPTPSSLSPDALARRLAELVADERAALVDFLLHLEEFDRRRAWAEAGYDSLWSYCQRVLHLREGPAGRRIGAMRVIRRFPRLADALRDGRLCLSTVTLLAPLLGEESLDDVVARAAYRTKAEVEHLVASFLPREPPRDGIRRLPERQVSDDAASASPVSGAPVPPSTTPPAARSPVPESPPMALPCASPPPLLRESPARPTLTPVSADVYSLRVTIDAATKADLDELQALLSHKVPSGDVSEVLREAIRCALEKHGRRRGARPPGRERTPTSERPAARGELRAAGTPGSEAARAGSPTPAPEAAQPEASGVSRAEPREAERRPHVPAHVRREVWRRDGGRCTYRGPGGHRCDSRWQLELDHVTPFALGGVTPTAEGLRLRCRVHNQLYAEQVYGADHMARFRRDGPGRVRLLIPGSGAGGEGALRVPG